MLLHITTLKSWNDAEVVGEYRDPSLEVEGFIHCSTADQVTVPANELFAGRQDLVLLVIDPAQVDAAIAYEDCYDTGRRFPHVYGPIPVRSVVAVVDFRPDSTGTFPEPSLGVIERW